MNWYKRLKFAGMPYGYWISPEGKLLEVQPYGHERFALSYLKKLLGTDDYFGDPYTEMFKRQFCRCITRGDFIDSLAVETPSQGATSAQKKQIADLVKYPQYTKWMINNDQSNVLMDALRSVNALPVAPIPTETAQPAQFQPSPQLQHAAV